MKHLLLCLCLLVAPLTGSAGAAAPRNRSVASATSKAKRKATPTRRAAARSRTVAAKAASKPDTAAAPTRTVAAARRLEDIHIEGEIPAPQVLFVTARDQRRFTKFHHQRYLKSSAKVGETTVLPGRVAVTRPPSAPAGAP